MKNANMFTRLLALVLCVMLFAATAMMSVGYAETAVETPEIEYTVLGEGNTAFVFVVVDLEGNETYFEIHTDAEMVGTALVENELIAGEDSEYGLYVKSVLGITADWNVDGHYWAFYVMEGGAEEFSYAATGVDSTPIVDGAAYMFKVE